MILAEKQLSKKLNRSNELDRLLQIGMHEVTKSRTNLTRRDSNLRPAHRFSSGFVIPTAAMKKWVRLYNGLNKSKAVKIGTKNWGQELLEIKYSLSQYRTSHKLR